MTAIVNKLAGVLAGKLAEKILESYQQKDPDAAIANLGQLKTIVNEASEKVISSIKLEIAKARYQDQVIGIKTKMNSMTHVLNELKNNPDSKKAAEYAQDLKHGADNPGGATYTLNAIDNIVRSADGVAPQGLIEQVEKTMFDDLCDYDKPECSIKWYLSIMYDFMAAVISVQQAGFALQLFMSQSDQSDIARFTKEHQSRINDQLAFAYEKLHPAVRAFKKDFASPIDPQTWWGLTAGDRRLNSDAYGEKWVRLENMSHADSCIWQFEPMPDESEKSCLVNRAQAFPIRRTFGLFPKGFGRSPASEYRLHCYDRSLTGKDKGQIWKNENAAIQYLTIVPLKDGTARFRLIPEEGHRNEIDDNWLFHENYMLERGASWSGRNSISWGAFEGEWAKRVPRYEEGKYHPYWPHNDKWPVDSNWSKPPRK